MTATQHTEATRKKLREAAFFLSQLASVDRKILNRDPEATDFYLSAFLTAARAVGFVLKKERTDEWNAWILNWRSERTAVQLAHFDYLVDQRNKVEKEGGPEVTITVSQVSLHEFMREVRLTGGNVFMSHMPGLPPPSFSKQERTLTARPDQTLAEACQPLFEVMQDLVDDFEKDHPPT